jgi:hypothetical protein
MTKLAHITSRPGHELGEKVLGLCGKEFKVKVLWADLPDDKPICRTCVDAAMKALTEADELIMMTRSRVRRLSVHLKILSEVMDAGLLLDDISERDADHLEKQVGDALAKADRKRAKQTCTCTWTSAEMFEENPDCPIHGGELDAVPVEIEDVPLPEEDQE